MKEQNRLIAEFMGIRSDDGKTSHESSEYYYEDCELEYHTSWDWLMPVVEKIESIGGQQVFINGSSCNIYGERHETIKAYGNKLESTYASVVEFIKWYNENKKN